MTVTAIMGQALDQELQARGIFSLSRQDCEAIVARVLERSATIASSIEQPREAAKKLWACRVCGGRMLHESEPMFCSHCRAMRARLHLVKTD